MICDRCKNVKCLKVDVSQLAHTPFMIVGEKPTAAEPLTGRKFTAYAYTHLATILKDLNMLNESYATYVLKAPALGWAAVNLKKCQKHLLAEIQAVKPKVIVALGPEVAKFLTGKQSPLEKLRQAPFWSYEYNAWIVSTYSPKFMMSQYGLKYRQGMKNDFVKARLYASKEGQVQKDIKTYTWIGDVEKNKEMLQKMIDMLPTEISFDIETEGLDYCKDEILALGFAWTEEFSYTIDEVDLQKKEILDLVIKLFDTKHTFTGQNAKFDTSFLRFDEVFKNIVIPNARYDDDTMLMQYCVDERTGMQGLKTWAKEYFDAHDWDAPLHKFLPNKEASWRLIPKELLHKYLGYDVHYTLRGSRLLKKLMKEEETLYCYETVLLPVAQAFTEIEMEGILLDVDELKQKMKEAEPEIARIAQELDSAAREVGWSPEEYVKATGAKTKPDKLNPKSSKQMQWVAYDLCSMPLWNMGKDGYKKSCCKDAVEVYRFKHPFWKKLHEYKEVNDLFGTYVKGMLERVDEDNKIRPDFYLVGTRTGRISCKSPNLQNIPRKSFVKNMFIVPEDYVFVNVDYKTLEVVVAAILSGDPIMSQPFIDGTDFHSQTTWKVYKEDLNRLADQAKNNEYSALRKYLERPQMAEVRDYVIKDYLDQGNFQGAWDQIFDFCRFLTKFVTFGILYGRGAKSLAEGELNCTLAEAKYYLDSFLAEYPVFQAWMEKVRHQAYHEGYVQTAFGFKRRWLEIDPSDYRIANQAVNTPKLVGPSYGNVCSKLCELLESA